MDLIEEIEVESIARPLKLLMPPSIVFRIGMHELTHIQYSQFRLKFRKLTLNKTKEILETWRSSSKFPVCIIKFNSSSMFVWTPEEARSSIEQLVSSNTQFIAQKFIITSKQSVQLIRISFTISPESISAKRITQVVSSSSEEDSFAVRDLKKSERIIPSQKLIEYAKLIKNIVVNFATYKVIKGLEIDFLKDLAGEIYYLKVSSLFKGKEFDTTQQTANVCFENVSHEDSFAFNPIKIQKRNKKKQLNWSFVRSSHLNSPNTTQPIKEMISALNQSIQHTRSNHRKIVRITSKSLTNKIHLNRKKKIEPAMKSNHHFNRGDFVHANQYLRRAFLDQRAQKLVNSCSESLVKLRKTCNLKNASN